MPNPVTWFEILGKDPIKLQKFYKDVFGWKLGDPMPQMSNYSLLDNEGDGIGGGIGGDPTDQSRVIVYIEVNDLQAYLDKAAQAGAQVLMAVTVVTPEVTIAMFADTEGNPIGLLKGTA